MIYTKDKKLKTQMQFEFDADAKELAFQDITFESDLASNIKDKTIKVVQLKKKIKTNDGSTRLF